MARIIESQIRLLFLLNSYFVRNDVLRTADTSAFTAEFQAFGRVFSVIQVYILDLSVPPVDPVSVELMSMPRFAV